MIKNLMAFIPLFLLVSCNQPSTETTTTDSQTKENITTKLTIKDKKEFESGCIAFNDDAAIYLVNGSTATFSYNKPIYMWNKLESQIAKKGLNVSLLNENKEKLLENQPNDFKVGINYSITGPGGSITLSVDGTNNKVGYYISAYISIPVVLYQMEYEEGDEKIEFEIYLPKQNDTPIFTYFRYETPKEYVDALETYHL